ncbi:MAG: hypothetical protein LC132_01480 [Burkholderiales bacterium]|nr:hypothetical protein [Burkholderiales bacterium]
MRYPPSAAKLCRPHYHRGVQDGRETTGGPDLGTASKGPPPGRTQLICRMDDSCRISADHNPSQGL